MSEDEWFRSPDWGAEAQSAFEAKLARAHPKGRPQYRRIKAIGLLGTTDPVRQAAGREMLEHVIADPHAYRHERVGALCFLARHEQETNRLDAAEQHLRVAIGLIATHASGSTGMEEVRLAEILLARGGPAELAEARELVDRTDTGPFLSNRFRHCLAGVRISLALGDKHRATEWARLALGLAFATRSGLANHPKLALVETDEATKSWLVSIVNSVEPLDGGRLDPKGRQK